jgi:hypothetical protein
MAAPLTSEIVESTINALPVQGRIMLRLLLIQYLDLTQEDIDYIAADRPDPRFVSGAKPLVQVVAKETIVAITNRVAQYRAQTRRKREQIWLQSECLGKQIAYGEALCAQAERLLTERFGLSGDDVAALKAQARAALPKPAIRELDRQWEKAEVADSDYRRTRLGIVYQTELRKLERERKRLETVLRDYAIACNAPLQDHELGHVWGIPAGTLAARKAKFLHHYLQGVQVATHSASQPSLDLWKETLAVMATRPVERSTAPYDGMDKTEAALTANLQTFALKTLAEDMESRAWLNISLSLFALQRLLLIQSERDMDADTLGQTLLQRAAPPSQASPDAGVATQPRQIEEWQEHILRSMKGEDKR